MILATWYKKNLRSGILAELYVDQAKTQGIEIESPEEVTDAIYQQYIEAFKVGVYDYIKEEYNETLQERIPKKYFSTVKWLMTLF